MEIDFQTLDPYARYKLMASLIVPRPIALITTLEPEGTVNAAPFSMFNMVGDCLLYTSPSPRDQRGSRMPSSA